MIRPCPRRVRFALVAVALALGFEAFEAFEAAPAAAASPADAGPSGPSASPASAQSAEKLAEKAYELHGAGKFAEAIATYLQAYAISNAPAVLFNVAMIYDHKLHEPELAAEYYRRYLGAADVEPDLVQKANARLAAIKLAEQETKAREATPRPPPEEPPAAAAPAPSPAPSAPAPGVAPTAASPVGSVGSGRRTAGLVVGVAGLAGLGASAVLAVVAKSKNDDANAVCNGAACSNEQGVTLARDAGTFATASTVAFIGGAALAAAGVIVYLSAPRAASPSSAWVVAPLVARSGAGLSLQAGF
jgi:tetratricopeptide (TPR) repeat protein